MDPSAISPSPPSIRPPSSSRGFIVLVSLVCALVFILALGVVVVFKPTQLNLVRHVDVLSQGHADLDVPLMTLYTAPKIPGETIDSNVSWSILSTHDGPSTAYRFQWSEVTPGKVPVRFVLNSTSSEGSAGAMPFLADGSGFLFYPAGICGTNCTASGVTEGLGGAGIEDVFFEKWRLIYTVFNVTEVLGSERASFLEVDFSISRLGSVGDRMPAANVSRPGPEALASIGIDNLAAGSKITISAQGWSGGPNLFRHNVTTVAFDAGSLGTIPARLSSQYRWSTVDDYRLSFSASRDTTIEYFWDLRFGSLLLVYLPDAGS